MPMSPRLLRPLASGLTNPKAINGLQLWLDASDVSGMAQLSDGTTAVTSDADPVGYWPDKSGNGYHATQSITNNRPAYRTGVRNGRSTLRFDGNNDSFRVASIPLDATISVFVAAQFNVATVGGNLLIEHSANSNGNSGFYFAGDTNFFAQIHRPSSPVFRWVASGSQWFGTSWAVGDLRISAGASLDDIFSVRKNGASVSNVSSLQSSGTVSSNRSATADLFIGARNQASFFSNGDYAEILVYNRPLTDAEHKAVRRYLGRKWSVTVT